jgi:hypothetical protein
MDISVFVACNVFFEYIFVISNMETLFIYAEYIKYLIYTIRRSKRRSWNAVAIALDTLQMGLERLQRDLAEQRAREDQLFIDATLAPELAPTPIPIPIPAPAPLFTYEDFMAGARAWAWEEVEDSKTVEDQEPVKQGRALYICEQCEGQLTPVSRDEVHYGGNGRTVKICNIPVMECQGCDQLYDSRATLEFNDFYEDDFIDMLADRNITEIDFEDFYSLFVKGELVLLDGTEVW